jgi:hypothetical protein
MTCWRKGVKPGDRRQASPVALNLLVKMPAAVVISALGGGITSQRRP